MTQWLSGRLDAGRLSLSRHDAPLLQLALLGLVTGLLAGGAIVLFRFMVEGAQESFLPGNGSENYEGLSQLQRFLLPIGGALFIAAMYKWFSGGLHVLGVARVMERMAYHQGHLTVRGFFLQFFGAAAAIISGHSVGREGPHIYLGAASGSLLGQRLELPNNSVRTMVGCGTAAGIAASFNTPLAGVIFSLEVVMMDYTVASFIPVILAAVAATALSNAILGTDPAFLVPAIEMGSLTEMPLVLVLGILTGAASALFIHMLQSVARHSQPVAIWWRIMIAGLMVGMAGAVVPEIMGIGYDSVNKALLGQFGLTMLAILILLKLTSTAVCVGMGVPGGMIGPALFIGACLGSLAGILAEQYIGIDSHIAFYALLGMGAMMGASLQAPLAALTAMMELTHAPGIIMPGMLVIVVASLTASEIFRKESLFISMLKSSGLDYKANPVLQALRRVGVAGVMNSNFIRTENTTTLSTARQLLTKHPDWLLISDINGPAFILPAIDLAREIESRGESDAEQENGELDLAKIPAERLQIGPINLSATLQEALELMDNSSNEALYVERMTAPGIKRIYGILTREQIESAYKY